MRRSHSEFLISPAAPRVICRRMDPKCGHYLEITSYFNNLNDRNSDTDWVFTQKGASFKRLLLVTLIMIFLSSCARPSNS